MIKIIKIIILNYCLLSVWSFLSFIDSQLFFSSLEMFEMALEMVVRKKKFSWKIFTLVAVKLNWFYM